MDIAITLEDHPTKKLSLVIMKKLTLGKTTVYHVCSLTQRANYCLKLFSKGFTGAFLYQKEKLLSRLSHPNIVKNIPMKIARNDCYATMTEFLPNGDFFDLVTEGMLTNEVLVRTYFHQLIEGIEYLHSQGVAHLDLKLENLMLDANYQLKIIDFDHAQLIKDGHVSSGGTEGYRAPEVIEEKCSDLTAADVFSAGVLLYTFRAMEFPFLEKEDLEGKSLDCYLTYTKQRKLFWFAKNQRKGFDFFTRDFIELVNGMMHVDPVKRWKIREIKESKWYKGFTLDSESLKKEIKLRKELAKNRKALTERRASPVEERKCR